MKKVLFALMFAAVAFVGCAQQQQPAAEQQQPAQENQQAPAVSTETVPAAPATK